MIQTRRQGRFKASRIDRTTVAEWFNDLPKDLKQIVAKELNYYPHIPGIPMKDKDIERIDKLLRDSGQAILDALHLIAEIKKGQK